MYLLSHQDTSDDGVDVFRRMMSQKTYARKTLSIITTAYGARQQYWIIEMHLL